ncbi:MAG: AAA family ATPase [Candidatus Accumulibacter phosphatis]|uniref:Secretion ATPase, PEP-CTERM locus subfamily n=2 Tax=Candidatus Accumulibacter TaxID=327159 RepID=A0A080MB67_9PROT|nr:MULTISPECIES: AAA family ATPase [Candidatus Accumulibacter]KFB78483.1 MAG: putative secretion ATPase, PEP-CTERM locus subfamily [Candidatus Accumulibacter cognatus]MBL8400818.1 AAA family ATPase [Accumulibacter sp.]MCC2867516.1 AAA family ATPase [Candidatus Accumulibacter phosphatis]MCM8580322.1 AAA family ATPase [Accumulibacter sp.]MCM8620171.1 AAA family ATPase [Accumulibacter sp.]
MYLDHFGLQQAPFRITPHTEFFFAGANRGATLEALIYAITHDEGIVKVSGEVGSGKTMLCRMLLEKLSGQVETIYLANPLLSHTEILCAIAEELRIPLQQGYGHLLLRSLQERLLEIYADGRQVVALIDEAHAMPLAALEEVRLLSNLESSRHKLLQIVLFGQPELDQRLGEPALRQLNDRITHHFRLEPLHPNDIAAYLMFRLRAAGYHGPDLFTRRAIQLISRASEGLTRRINILADKALLAAFSEGVHQIDGRQVRAAIRDAQFKRIADPARARWLWVGVSTALCALGGLAYLASGNNAGGLPTAAANKATTLAPATLRETESSAMSTMAEPEPTFSRTATLGTAKLDTLAERIAATEVWLAQTPDSHYFIQLLMTDAGSQREISDFIVNHKRTLDLRQLRVYRSRFGGRERLGIIYGDYPSREQANAALATLGEVSQESKPYVRAVAKLRSSQLGRLE